MSNNHDYLLRIPDHVLRDKILTYFGYMYYVHVVCTHVDMYTKVVKHVVLVPKS